MTSTHSILFRWKKLHFIVVLMNSKRKKLMSHDWSHAAIMLRSKRCEKRLHGQAKDGSFSAGGLPKFNQISFGQISIEFVGPIVSL